jgi:hypothetical protein
MAKSGRTDPAGRVGPHHQRAEPFGAIGLHLPFCLGCQLRQANQKASKCVI